MIRYFDSSVLLHIILNLDRELKIGDNLKNKCFTSRLSQVEVLRAIMKGKPELLSRATRLLLQLEFVEISDQVIDDASSYPHEISLKSADAIHMATAELLLDVDDVLVTFDKQMAKNAKKLGIKVATSL